MSSTAEKLLRKIPFYLLFFGLYPALALWLANITQIPPYAVVRALFICLAVTVSVFILCWLLIRSTVKAGLVSALVLAFILFYGHIFNLFDNAAIGSAILGRHRYLIPLGLLLLAAASVGVIRARRKSLYSWNFVLNIAGIFLVSLVGIQILIHELRSPDQFQTVQSAPLPAASDSSSEGRDVYYILLDTYARQDILANELDIDNSDFIRQLEELGFIVDSCAQVNYDNTAFSLTSSLNMNYLDALGVPNHPDAREEQYDDLISLLKHSRARQAFENLGYQFVTFKTLYPWIDITDSDIYFDAEASTPLLNRQESLNFTYLFMKTTALRPLLEYLDADPERLAQLPSFALNLVNPDNPMFSLIDYGQYQQNEFAFDTLETLPEIPGKKFVYAHLFAVHQPYVYRADGGYTPATSIEGPQDYANAIRHTDQRILKIVKNLIKNSKVPPVIILQGDHGKPTTNMRVRELNALYLPEDGGAKFYPGMTPVNTFRLILDTYFGQNYGLLPDHSYHAPYKTPYQMESVAPNCAAP